MSLSRKRWTCHPVTAKDAEALASALGLRPALARLLVNRGLTNTAQARAFLNPSLNQLVSPWQMDGMESAVARILLALEQGEKVMVHGDYDADGITATVILVEALRQLGGVVDYYLPSRFQEGYGLHREALDKIRDDGASLLVTVDCGINAADEVNYARSLGIEVIVTDHHQPLVPLKGAVAVLNPLRGGCSYPFKQLSGAGVAFKLAAAFLEKSGDGFPVNLLDLAALGTVADVVPLLGENRVLVSCGLAEINRSPRPGLQALAAAAGLNKGQINSTGLAMILAPALNAAGRLGEAGPAARLLLERDEQEAAALAGSLRQENQRRREIEMRILEEAEAIVTADPGAAGENVITLAREGWHHGVIGIVASRLVDRFYRPVVLIALEGDVGRGSARSIPGFNITAALNACAPLLERFGGHEQAAGLSVEASQVDALRQELNRFGAAHLRESSLVPALCLDGELAENEIDLELARQIAVLEPFGTENPVPLFSSMAWELQSWRLVGSGKKHLKFNLKKGDRFIAPVYFSSAGLEPALERGRKVDLAFTLREEIYRGDPVLSMQLKDMRYGDCGRHGRVAVVDRRSQGSRTAVLASLLGAGDAPVAIFVGTKERREEVKRSIPAGKQVFFLTSGGNNGAPEYDGECRDLILYDLPLSGSLLEPFFKSCPDACEIRVILLYNQKDRQRNELLMDLSLPTAGILKEICDAVAESAAADGGISIPATAAKRLPFHPGESFWRRCRAIFTETGALDGKEQACRIRDTWPESLAGSPAYQAAQSLREDCAGFQELLLTGSPGELARFWDGRRQ